MLLQDHHFLEMAVLPGGFPQYVASFASARPVFDDLRRLLPGSTTPSRPRRVRSLVDGVSVRGPRWNVDAQARLRRLLHDARSRPLELGNRRVRVRYWRRRARDAEPAYGYAHNFELRDEADGTVVALVQMGLVQGFYVVNDKVKVDVKGQGCARSLAGAILELVVPSVLSPFDALVGVDAAVDVDAPTAALMILDSGLVPRARFRKVVTYPGPTPLARGMRLGAGTSRASVKLYDKREQVRHDRFDSDGRGITPLAAEFSLPEGLPPDLCRVEVRVRDVPGFEGVDDALRAARQRIAVADIRQTSLDRPIDAALLAMARQHGLTRSLMSPTHQKARAPEGGLGGIAQAEMLRAGVGAERAHSAARRLQDRASEILAAAAEGTAFDLASLVEGAWRRERATWGESIEGDR